MLHLADFIMHYEIEPQKEEPYEREYDHAGKGFDRVTDLSMNFHDNLVKVEDISFDSLETVGK